MIVIPSSTKDQNIASRHPEVQGGEPYNKKRGQFRLHKVVDSIQVGPSTSSTPQLDESEVSALFHSTFKPGMSLFS